MDQGSRLRVSLHAPHPVGAEPLAQVSRPCRDTDMSDHAVLHSAPNRAGQRDARRVARVRVPAPFPCSFARVGLKKWLTTERQGMGVVFDLSRRGARLMTEAAIAPGDELAIDLRFPNQASSMFVKVATVRW